MYNNNIILSLIILRDRGNPVKSRRIEKIETQKVQRKRGTALYTTEIAIEI